MLVVAVTMGCAGQKAGMANDPDPGEMTLNADCIVDAFDVLSIVDRPIVFLEVSSQCWSQKDLVAELRRDFAVCLSRIDSTATAPEYRDDSEVFIAPCLGPEVATVYQGERSDSVFAETMMARYVKPTGDTPGWWFDPCRTDWSLENCQLACPAGQVSYYRLDMSQRLFFRFWQRTGGYPSLIEVNGITKHDRGCSGNYHVTQWELRSVKTYIIAFDDGSDDAEEDSVKPSIQI